MHRAHRRASRTEQAKERDIAFSIPLQREERESHPADRLRQTEPEDIDQFAGLRRRLGDSFCRSFSATEMSEHAWLTLAEERKWHEAKISDPGPGNIGLSATASNRDCMKDGNVVGVG